MLFWARSEGSGSIRTDKSFLRQRLELRAMMMAGCQGFEPFCGSQSTVVDTPEGECETMTTR